MSRLAAETQVAPDGDIARPPARPDRIRSAVMSKSFAAPRTIRRIAARRVFHSANGRAVVLTIGVPQPVPGSDWGCPLQVTGLNTNWRRPRYVFGIDGLQALHLAMKSAAAVLESARPELEWLGERGNLGMPKFLPDLPRAEQSRLEAIVEREAIKFWRSVERAHKAKTSKKSKGRERTKASHKA